MIQSNSDSDVISLALSSPRSSPKRPIYFVQSPSRDSNDGEKLSSRATPGYSGPMDSPSHSSAFASSASRISGTFRPWKMYRKQSGKGWPGRTVIEEEEEYDGDDFKRHQQCLIAMLGLLLVFMVFCLIIWGASRPYKPQISVKSMTINSFDLGIGTDYTGVPTKFMTLNCSVKMIIYNPATFFSIHVSSTPLRLFYSEITVATGQLKKYLQPWKSLRIVWVNLEGDKVPLYGAGAGASIPVSGNSGDALLFRLEFHILTRGNIVGKLVKTEHRRRISCSFVLESSSTKTVKFKEDFCTY